MNTHQFPSRSEVTICFAHSAYQMAATFARYMADVQHFQAWTTVALQQQLHQADVLVISGMWHNELLAHAPRLRLRDVCRGDWTHLATVGGMQLWRLNQARQLRPVAP
jgi:hypothetical protein